MKISIFFILRSFQNFLKIFLKKNINNLYLPNLSLKNIVMVEPNKIKFVNSIPMKFYKSTKFIVNFDWDEDNKLVTEYKHPAYISCKELFVDGVDIEKCEEFYSVTQARELIAQEMFLFSNSGADDLEKLTDVGFSMARLSLYIPNLDAIDSIVFTKPLEEKIQNIFGNTIEYSITGIAQLWAGTMTNVLNSMRDSYIIALILITGL